MVTANVLSPAPVPHAFVYGFRSGDTTHLAGDTTNPSGQYSVAIATAGTPVTGYLAISDSGHHIDTYAYPAVPLAADVTENVLMVSSHEFALLAASAGINPMAGDGFIGVVVRNCQGTPVAGRDREEQPGWYRALQCGWVCRARRRHPQPRTASRISRTSPPGNVTVRATASGHALREHVVNARADAITLTEIQP